ncbi:MAG: Clp protease N-terminal domain-containing protein, partial [Geitlerinemataceae cyanobacterium]
MQPTNPNQFTEKAWEAIARTPDIAKAAQNQKLESEHLLKALLEQDGLATSIVNRAGIPVQSWRDRIDEFIAKQPKVSGSGTSIYLGQSLDTLLDRAEALRKEYGDEYISIEHLIQAYAKDDRLGKAIFKEFKINETQLKETISQIRGTQNVSDRN